MNFTFRTLGASILIAFVFLIFDASAQTGENASLSAPAVSAKVAKAQREIIKVVLENYFSGTTSRAISIISDNLSPAVRDNFPQINGLSIELVTLPNESGCPFQFHTIRIKEKTAEVSFGNCSEGLGYYLEQKAGKWKIAPMSAENSND